MFLAGLALLTPLGLAGAAVYVLGHALVKAALFLCVGIVLHRLGSVNETWLHGRGPAAAGHRRGVHAGRARAWPTCRRSPPSWARAGSRTPAPRTAWCLGRGRAGRLLGPGRRGGAAGRGRACSTAWATRPAEDPQMAAQASEENERDRSERQAAHPADHDRAAGRPGRRGHRGRAAARTSARPCRRRPCASRTRPPTTPRCCPARTWPTRSPCTRPRAPGSPWPTCSAGRLGPGRLILAALALYWKRLPLLRRGPEPDLLLGNPIRRFQSGVVNDYVTWIVIGVACIGGTLAFAIR